MQLGMYVEFLNSRCMAFKKSGGLYKISLSVSTLSWEKWKENVYKQQSLVRGNRVFVDIPCVIYTSSWSVQTESKPGAFQNLSKPDILSLSFQV